ncbi:MAG: hypothetical protein Q7K43_02485, partial [Candidatus Woesearchaeota archaeon]|nr:hypothetical protein [Candidatus Woesearchaeota archaeon]
EILKSATQQISGVEVVKQTGAQIPQTGEQQGSQQQAELVIKEQNAQRHYQTYKHELDEMSINNMLARRDAERQEERQKEQIQKQQVIQKKNNPLTEPIAKIKRGMAGGMGMLGLKRKQRSAELVKTPSN